MRRWKEKQARLLKNRGHQLIGDVLELGETDSTLSQLKLLPLGETTTYLPKLNGGHNASEATCDVY
jgi:hypothetical protein